MKDSARERRRSEWLAVLAILAGAICLWVFASWYHTDSRKVVSSDWLIYQNKAAGFSIDYPKSWAVAGEYGGPAYLSLVSEMANKVKDAGIPGKGGMWVDVVKQTCQDSGGIYAPVSDTGIAERTLCLSGYQITGGLWQDDPNKSVNEALVSNILASFKRI